MSRYENDMLEFAAEWAPFGGNDDEAFLRFGLCPREFHIRLMRLLGSPAARALDNSTVARLRDQCVDRLTRASPGRPIRIADRKPRTS
ncbi:Protein of unknown function [Nocardia amikacinitolerans]|uniref:DUF3263 domain-containing protein n=1 Tax=Nocardia amikacinitolerans TaxID=756689 RepID=A0A285L9Q2_9NOCA|nr:DUF3263 domain-containing protein [Nocardia amikacinitolerans]MCP2280458.1 Protein of unknown function (DUF3263) [Nocardia amikacinitolerans]SNY81678.1 Protein of unknown function [Nocardia amikacinitolerans]